MKNNSRKSGLLETDSLIRHAGQQAEAALRHATGIVDAERAWAAAKPMVLPAYEEGGRNQFGVTIKNVGRTPAKVIQTCLLYQTLKDLGTLPIEPAYQHPETHTGVILFPNGEPIGRVSYLQPESVLTKSQIIEIEKKRLFLYGYGFVTYRCVFNCPECPHETRFGYVYNFPQSGEPPLEGFIPAGPEGYNRAT